MNGMKEIAVLVISQMLGMSVCMGFGYFCYKKGELDNRTIRDLACLTMRYTIPVSIALSFREQFRFSRICQWGQVFLLSSLGFLMIIAFMTMLIPGRIPDYQQKRLCGLVPNNAIFGLALAQSLFGSEGVFLISSQIVVSNILLWTYGTGILSSRPDMNKMLLNPAVSGVLAGILLVVLPLEIPQALYRPAEQLAQLNAPIGLMLAGGYMARIDLGKCLGQSSYYLLAACRLIIGPAFLVPVLLLLHIPRTVALTVLAGMLAPTGTAVATFSEMAGMDNTFSSGSIAFNQLACVITIPVMMTVLMYLF